MKNLFVCTALLLLSALSFAQSEKFTAAMQKNIALIDAAFVENKPDAFLELANAFERIGNAEKNQWLPFYYAAYCKTNFAFMQQDKSNSDPLADQASALIDKADSLQPDNSEISCIKSMIASLRLMVNPQQRFMQFGVLSDNLLKKAKDQDPSNPRPYTLKGQNLKFTPEQFGGGCKNALKELTVAAEKFTSFKPASPLHPSWGKEYTQMLIDQCK